VLPICVCGSRLSYLPKGRLLRIRSDSRNVQLGLHHAPRWALKRRDVWRQVDFPSCEDGFLVISNQVLQTSNSGVAPSDVAKNHMFDQHVPATTTAHACAVHTFLSNIFSTNRDHTPCLQTCLRTRKSAARYSRTFF